MSSACESHAEKDLFPDLTTAAFPSSAHGAVCSQSVCHSPKSYRTLRHRLGRPPMTSSQNAFQVSCQSWPFYHFLPVFAGADESWNYSKIVFLSSYLSSFKEGCRRQRILYENSFSSVMWHRSSALSDGRKSAGSEL